MYAKVIDPKTNGKKVYDNKGSALRTTNYLAKEAKDSGEAATFFGTPGSAEKSAEEVTSMIDSNRKGLRKDDAKFYSLVLSPSPAELTYIGNDLQGLKKYTQQVMEDYAKNFTLKNARGLGEADLVWAATIHRERKSRSTDEGKQGEKKSGLQTHIHIIVSARDADQTITLNPLGTADRFDRVQFQAKAVARMEIQFGRVQAHDVTRPAPTHKQLIAEKAEEITTKAAANRREKKPLTVEQLAAKDGRLDTQVARLNSKLDASQQLNPEQVKEVARERGYDDVFYKTLTRIERNAEQGTYTHNPYEYLATGRVSRSGELMFDESDLPHPTPTYPLREQEPEILRGSTHALAQTIERLSQALVPASKTQDVPSEVKSKDKPSKPGLTQIVNQLSQAMTPMSKTQDVRSEVERDDDYELD